MHYIYLFIFSSVIHAHCSFTCLSNICHFLHPCFANLFVFMFISVFVLVLIYPLVYFPIPSFPHFTPLSLVTFARLFILAFHSFISHQFSAYLVVLLYVSLIGIMLRGPLIDVVSKHYTLLINCASPSSLSFAFRLLSLACCIGFLNDAAN